MPKTKKATGSKPVASVISLRGHHPGTNRPTLSGGWDDAVSCSDIVGIGRVSLTNYEQRQPHDYIALPSLSVQGISEKSAQLYASGLTLRQISKELNCSKTHVRKTLLDAGTDLRPKCGGQRPVEKVAQKFRTGNAPFGYRILRGRLILDAAEIEIVQLVMNHWHSGKSYAAIARHLNDHKIKNRKATPWDHSLVRSIVERHKDKKVILEENQSWESNY
jgi:hypothetical protein